MDTGAITSNLFTLGFGVLFLLSSIHNWDWLWKINGLGRMMVRRYGHKAIRMYTALIGIAIIAGSIRQMIDAVLVTTWGRVLCIGLVMAVGFTVVTLRNRKQ